MAKEYIYSGDGVFSVKGKIYRHGDEIPADKLAPGRLAQFVKAGKLINVTFGKENRARKRNGNGPGAGVGADVGSSVRGGDQ